MKKYYYLLARLNWLGAGFHFCAALWYEPLWVLGAARWYEPLWVLGAAFSVFGAWLADRMYEAEEPA